MANTIVKRTQLEHYMDVGSAETPQWARMGDGWSKFDDATSAQTESTKYINMDTESTDTTSYKTAYNFECDLMYSDPTIKKVYEIYKNRKVLGDCLVKILTVEKFNAASGGGYVARMETCAVAPSGTSENNNKMKLSGAFNGLGDPVIGKFAPASSGGGGTFTADTAEAASANSESKAVNTEE